MSIERLSKRGGSTRIFFGVVALMLSICSQRVRAWSQQSLHRWRRPVTKGAPSTRCLAAISGEDSKPRRKSKKITINPNITEANLDKLALAFDEMAQSEGFDSSTAIYADAEGFDDDDRDASILGDLESGDFLDDDDDDDDFIDFGGDGGESMEDRIASAKRNDILIPEEMERFAKEKATVRDLGFRAEANPFGNDETPRKEEFRLVQNALACSACGSDFQTGDESKPGYLPSDKYDVQLKLAKIEELQTVQEKAEGQEWSPEDEIEWLIRTQGKSSEEIEEEEVVDIDIGAAADELGLDLDKLTGKKVICKRCHGLQNYGKVEESLRPGWTEEPLLSQERFRELLRPIREKTAVIVALVDIFDFSGSVLPELDNIAGGNPVILAANKADLLPSSMGPTRIENWVRRELEYLGIRSLANIGGAVRLVSCKTGAGVGAMLDKARALAEEMDADIYVVGAANAGKSTLLNHILSQNESKKKVGKIRAGNKNALKGAVTTSPLPGTTLKFIKVDLGGRALYDTPGLLVPGTLTQLLTPEELKMVVPAKQVEPVTFRVAAGKCVLIGGLARVELVGDCKPFMFTFFVANGIKLHVTDSTRADDFVAKHTGELLTPPLEVGRLEEIGKMESHTVDIEGVGWKEAAADISLTGLGWVAVTGAGMAKVKVSVPGDIGVSVRPPLMPFDIWEAAAKYTGSKAVRKPSKGSKGRKKRGGVGRR